MRTVKKTLCLVLVLSMVLSFAAISAAAKFEDADEIEAKYTEAAEVLNAIGVLTGFEDGTFRAGETLTREQSAAIVARLLSFNGIGVASSFTDSHEWSDGYIAFCEQLRIVAGYGDGTFGPEDTLTGGQFMKMLLVALGYDPIKEGLQDIGDAWIINVARLAKQIGLDAGIEDFPYLDAITREQAAQLALNALKTPLVQYSSAGNVEYVTSTVAEEQNISNARLSNTQFFTVELGERYFKTLKLDSVSNNFEQPSNKWTQNGKPIGTYARSPKLTYTTMVTASTIYNDLGLGAPIPVANIHVYVDGAASVLGNQAADDTKDANGLPTAMDTINKTNTLNKFGGNGAVTTVYYTSSTNSITICVVNTYVGKVTSVTGATSARNASATVSFLSVAEGASNPVAGNSVTYTTTDFAVGDIVAYTYSKKAGVAGVASMKLADKVEGKLESATANVSVTLDGTVYVASRNKVPFADATSYVGKTLTVYLDDYGYALYTGIGGAASTTAVVLGYQAGSYNISSDTVRLLFPATGADATGTMIYKLDSTTKKLDTVGDATDGNVNFYDLVTYEGTGPYTVKSLAANAYAVEYSSATGANLVTKGAVTPSGYFKTYNTGTAMNLTFDGKTTFIVATAKADGLGSSYTYAKYDGIANVPTIPFDTSVSGAKVYVSVYSSAKNGKTADVVFIMNGANTAGKNALTPLSGSKDLVFIMGNPGKSATYVDGGSYYSYKAIVNGEEVADFRTTSPYTENTLIAAPNYNGKGELISAESTVGKAAADAPKSDKTLGSAIGVYNVANDTVQLGGKVYAVSKDVKVYFFDTLGGLTTGGMDLLASVAENWNPGNDQAYFQVNDKDTQVVTTIFIQEVYGGGSSSSSTTPVTKTWNVTLSSTSANYLTATVKNNTDASLNLKSVALYKNGSLLNTVDLTGKSVAAGGSLDVAGWTVTAASGDTFTATVTLTDGSSKTSDAYKF